jgi:hypothetical protein
MHGCWSLLDSSHHECARAADLDPFAHPVMQENREATPTAAA